MLMFQQWRDLLAMHWEVEPEAMQRLLPHGLELDLYQGKAYATVTPFSMSDVRPAYVPRIPFVTASHEVNVRTYVKCNGEDPGIWFLSLDASNPLAVAGARATLGMPYYPAMIQLDRRFKGEKPKFDFRMHRISPLSRGKKAVQFHVTYRPEGEVFKPAMDSLDAFLMERYITYSTHLGALLKIRIDHEPWRLQNAHVHLHRQSLLEACDAQPTSEPFAIYGGGVDVRVTAIEPVTTAGVLNHPLVHTIQDRIARSA